MWLFASASDPLRQGFARVLNHSDASGTATVTATDDAGRTYEPLTLTLGPRETAPFNSDDLEAGNAAKGLAGGTGPGTGGWRFEVESDTLDVEALGYLRTADGFVTAMVATAPADEDGTRHVATFNPASNVNQVSHLRLVNPHDEEVEATITGVDDAGRSPGRARGADGAGRARRARLTRRSWSQAAASTADPRRPASATVPASGVWPWSPTRRSWR